MMRVAPAALLALLLSTAFVVCYGAVIDHSDLGIDFGIDHGVGSDPCVYDERTAACKGTWDFTVAKNGYCWRSCSFTGDEMILALEISVTAVIVLSVASFCTIRINNRRKYMKIVRGAEQLTDPEGEESWDRHCEEPTNMERVRLTAQAVSWED
ncbi:hypothetical protein KIPB_003716 [Kipferlia bialata]|uniref:Uncharacterized protein n=1 Tax=Kipferlia bialata TaxID=797122 RepID=A0A9K3GHN1_9EUKA|nr:hypothetical protein KIPB_003716 [Kipferlia bialata]|eukprot:g3716.t1